MELPIMNGTKPDQPITVSMTGFVTPARDWLIEFFTDPNHPVRLKMQPLIEAHQEEIVLHKHVQKLNPDWPRYAELAKTGRIFMVFGFADDELIAYALMFVQKHLHDKELVYALDDVYYVKQDERQAGTGAKLIAQCEEEARARGAKLITMRTKLHRSHIAFFEFNGYHQFEMVMAKEL